MTDLVNLDRVRGLLRTVYWRRKFLASRDDKRRTLNAEAEGIPAIVLEPTPATPPLTETNPFETTPGDRTTPSPPLSRSPSSSPQVRSGPLHSPDTGLVARHRFPSVSLSPRSPPAQSLSRQASKSSMLSSEDAHYRRQVARMGGTASRELTPIIGILHWRSQLNSSLNQWRLRYGET